MSEDREPGAFLQSPITPADPSRTQLIEHPIVIHVYGITGADLDALMAGYNSNQMNFFFLCSGVFVSLLISLLTVSMPDRTFAVFISVCVLPFVLTLSFGLAAWRDRKRITERFKQIRETPKT